jgi:hypothetical protein
MWTLSSGSLAFPVPGLVLVLVLISVHGHLGFNSPSFVRAENCLTHSVFLAPMCWGGGGEGVTRHEERAREGRDKTEGNVIENELQEGGWGPAAGNLEGYTPCTPAS